MGKGGAASVKRGAEGEDLSGIGRAADVLVQCGGVNGMQPNRGVNR